MSWVFVGALIILFTAVIAPPAVGFWLVITAATFLSISLIVHGVSGRKR